SGLNQEVFERADRILVPVTPDLPALRAAVQLRDIAAELGIQDRLAMVINRAASGVSVADMERTVGMRALALIRSGGLLFVGAANGLTVSRRVFAEMGDRGGAAHRTNSHPAGICRNGPPPLNGVQARGPSPPRFGRPADDFAPPGGGLFFRFTVVEAGFECFV